MKKILITFIALALLLTACGQVNENSTLSDLSSETQVNQIIDRHITEIEMYETGGEDGRENYWHFFADEYGKNMLVFEDRRFHETKIYELSAYDYNEISSIDFSRYIGKKDDNEGVCDAVYCDVIIRYDDNTEEKSEASIPELWQKFYYFLYECEPVEVSTENDNAASTVEDLGKAYFKEPAENDIVFDEKTGIKYVKNQLIVSVAFNTDKQLVDDMAEEINADIVGMIELTGDYQIEFKSDKTLDELEEIAEHIMSRQFVSNAAINMIIETASEDEIKQQ